MRQVCDRRMIGWLGGVMLAMLLLAGVGKAQDVDTSHQITAYGSAIASQPLPAGWQLYWNPDGPVEDRSKYQALEYDAANRRYGVLDEQGKFQGDKPYASIYMNYAAMDKSKSHGIWLIASYTLQADAKGSVWINHLNVQNRSFMRGNAVRVVVNDKQVLDKTVSLRREPAVYQVELGALKKGDAIQVAVGPADKHTNAGGRLQFVIEDVPQGQKPGPAVNLISPNIDEASPQRDGDGSIGTSFGKIHESQNALMLEKQSQLVLMGDSITYRWPEELLEKHLGQYKPAKLAVAGNWTQNVLWQVRHSELDKLKPRGVVLLIGTNNLSNGFTPDEVVQGMAAVVEAIHQKSPETRVLILGILPRGGSVKEAVNRKIEEVNMKVGALTDGKRVFFLDVTSALVEPDGSILKEVMPDKLHVAMPGFERWMAKLEPAVKEMMEK